MAYDSSADFFLKIEGIDGECKRAGLEKWIELNSWSWGASQVASGGFGAGQSGSARVSFGELQFSMRMNSASPKIMSAMFQGKVFNKAKLVCRRAGGKDGKPINYLEMDFDQVLVAGQGFGGGSDGEFPMENLQLRFETIKMAYSQVKEGQKQGAIRMGWNAKTNKKV
mgnify:CR=1 FL=1